MKWLPVIIMLGLVTLCSAVAVPVPVPENSWFTVAYANVLGEWQQTHPVGGGFVPLKFLDKVVRFAFSGEKYEYQCVEAYDGRSENGQLARITHNCRSWQRDAVFLWKENGTIIHGDGRCMEMEIEPSTLVEAPGLGSVYLVQFWDCDGGSNQQWAVAKESHKIHNLAKPELCISPLEFKNFVAAIDCKKAKDIGSFEFNFPHPNAFYGAMSGS